jgi:hypothetical protein
MRMKRIKQRQDYANKLAPVMKIDQKNRPVTVSTSLSAARPAPRLEKLSSGANCKRVVKSSGKNAHHPKKQVLDNKKEQRGDRNGDSRDTSRRTRSTAAATDTSNSPRCARCRLVQEQPERKRYHDSCSPSLRGSVYQHDYEEGGGGDYYDSQYTIHIDDDVSTTSDLTVGNTFGGDKDYYASAVFLTCPAVPNYVSKSWTIRVLDHEKAGDTLWFRIFCNGQRYEYLDLEDTEILSFVKMTVKVDGRFSFYVETDNGQVVFVESNLILDILRLLLVQAKTHDTVRIPTIYQRDARESAAIPKKQKTVCWPFSPFMVEPFTKSCERIGEI